MCYTSYNSSLHPVIIRFSKCSLNSRYQPVLRTCHDPSLRLRLGFPLSGQACSLQVTAHTLFPQAPTRHNQTLLDINLSAATASYVAVHASTHTASFPGVFVVALLCLVHIRCRSILTRLFGQDVRDQYDLITFPAFWSKLSILLPFT